VKFIFEMCFFQMKNDKFDPDSGLANIDKLPENLRDPMTEAVGKCRTADQGTHSVEPQFDIPVP
jgi:hypothetical protein